MEERCISNSPGQTEAYGEALAATLSAGAVVALFGGLGAGKTAFVRGLARGLGCADEVSSPTYALVHEYSRAPQSPDEAEPKRLIHFDMYRIHGLDELESTGYYDYLAQRCIMAVEWSEHILEALPEDAWQVSIDHTGEEDTRIITIHSSQ